MVPKTCARCLIDTLVALSATALGLWLFASTATAAASADQLTLRLSRTFIAANGTSTTTATASVTDASGNVVSGQVISLRSSDGRAWRLHRHGNVYTANITSSKKAGALSLDAHDQSAPSPDAYATLIQYGRAKHVAVVLSPPVILSDDTSFTTVTATVTDAQGDPVPADSVGFASSDPGQTPGPTTNHHDGTYSARIRSSATPGKATITATDQTAKVKGRATLKQLPNSGTTTLMVPQSSVVTNQSVTLLAEISSSAGAASGTMSFTADGTAVPGCIGEPIAPANSFALCQTSFSASTSPEQLAAIFTPDSSSGVAGSTGASVLDVGPDATSTSLSSSRSFVPIGESVTYRALVSAAHRGPIQPSGAVQFEDNGKVIRACTNQPLHSMSGLLGATCTLSYDQAAAHRITSIYNGDSNFSGSPSNLVPVPVQALGTIEATMQWSFKFARAYTTVVALELNGAPVGATVRISCHGGGCPFVERAITVRKLAHCPRDRGKCGRHRIGTVHLATALHNRRLRPGAHLIITVTRSGWVGKRYLFAMRAGKWPHVQIGCLAPGATRPGIDC